MSQHPLTDRPGTDLLAALMARTPARVLVGRAGPAYRTATQLALRRDHAAAVDAVQAELDLARDFSPLVGGLGLFLTSPRATSKEQHLLRPDRGRRLADDAAEQVRRQCPAGVDLQVI